MTTAARRPVGFVAGQNYPSPVVRLIGFGYHDGVTDGILQTADDAVYRFDLTGEEHNPDGLDERTFALRPLPPGAFEAVATLLAPAERPAAVVWVPRWPVAPPDRQVEIDRQLDTLLNSALPPTWEVRSRDLTDTVSVSRVAGAEG
ncbi:MAG TPA: hypothetical protein VH092_25710 [Urbifossiella sp.]|jgi:hypothetical protein|nr:hypothetical protein [Urbifossiella sp.]